MASYPEIILQIAPGVPPLEVTEDDWVTIDNSFILAIDIEKGKKEALDEVQPGTMTVTLDNQGRGFDPLYYQGTAYEDWFANGVRVRLHAYDAASDTEYSIFNGFIDGWPQQYNTQPGGIATLQATDAFKYINRASWAEEQYPHTVMQDTPVAYYRMNDVGTVMRDYSGNLRHGTWQRDVKSEVLRTDNSADSLVITSDGAIELSHEAELDYLRGEIPKEAMPNLAVFSFEFWFKCELPPFPVTPPVGTPSEWYISYARLFGDFYSSDLTIQPLHVKVVVSDNGGLTDFLAGALLFEVKNYDNLVTLKCGTGGYYDADGHPQGGGTNLCDNQPHHLVWTVDTGVQHLYVDGQEFIPPTDEFLWVVGTLKPSGAAALPITVNTVYNESDSSDIQAEWGDEAPFIDEVAFYDHALSAATVLQHFNDGARLWLGQTTGQRLTSVFNLIGWPELTADIGQTVLSLKTDWTDSPIDYINKIVTTEQGLLTVAHHLDGEFLFLDRNSVVTSQRAIAVQAIFTDENFTSSSLHAVQRNNPSFLASSNPSPVRYSDIVLRWDEKQVVNQVTVKFEEGEVTLSATNIDESAITARTIDTLLQTEEETESLASAFLNHYSSIFPRLESVTVRPSAMQGSEATEAWRACLDLREGDRIQVILTPQGIEPAISLDVLVEGIEHHLTNGVEWETQFYCSAGPLQTNYWVLGSSALGVDATLGY